MIKKLLTAIQEAELNASRAVEAHIDTDINVIGNSAAVLANFNQIKANNAAIFDATEAKGASLTTSSRKNDIRSRLGSETVKLAGVVQTFADDTNDFQLRDDMKVTPSQLQRMRDDEIAPFCQFIYNRASEHTSALREYNLEAADFTRLQTLINEYTAESPKPRNAVSQRKTTNANIAALFADNRKRLKKLDKQIETFRDENPDFVETYFNARVIVDPPKKKNKEPTIANS